MKEEKNKFEWMFSNTEYDNGKIDIHFILNTETGKVTKEISRRLKITTNEEEKICGFDDL